MILKTLSTGSQGNSYLLISNSGNVLIIEAGVKLKIVKKALNFNLSNIAGVIGSHLHLDHFGYAKEYAAAGIDIYANDETLASSNVHPHRAKTIVEGLKYKIGEYMVLPYLVVHDVKNFGFLISHPEMGLCSFITDTQYSPFIFPGLNNLLLECNYSDNILEERVTSGDLHPQLAERIKGSHMAESTMLEFLKANDTTQVNNIVIIHLSNGNSDAAQIVRNVTQTTGITPVIAAPGLKIEFNKTAF